MKKTLEEKLGEMKKIPVNTPDGKVSLFYLCEDVGVENRVVYFNYIEKKSKNVFGKFSIRKTVFDRGAYI